MAKAAAGRDKDRDFCKALLLHGYVDVEAALPKVALMPLDAEHANTVSARNLVARIRMWAKEARPE